jgi:hypothetical protein
MVIIGQVFDDDHRPHKIQVIVNPDFKLFEIVQVFKAGKLKYFSLPAF